MHVNSFDALSTSCSYDCVGSKICSAFTSRPRLNIKMSQGVGSRRGATISQQHFNL